MERLKRQPGEWHSEKPTDNQSLTVGKIESTAETVDEIKKDAAKHLKSGYDMIIVETKSGTFIVDNESVLPYGENAAALSAIINIS